MWHPWELRKKETTSQHIVRDLDLDLDLGLGLGKNVKTFELLIYMHSPFYLRLRLGSCTQVSYMKFSSPFTGSFEVLLSCICCFARLKTVLNDVLHSLNGISIAKAATSSK